MATNIKGVNQMIKKVVLDCTSGGKVSIESTNNLVKFLNNKQTVDLVYHRIIDRVNQDKSKNTHVLFEAVKLLKVHMPTYHPTALDTYQKIEAFCQKINIPQNRPILKSVAFIQALIVKLKPSATATTTPSSYSTQYTTTEPEPAEEVPQDISHIAVANLSNARPGTVDMPPRKLSTTFFLQPFFGALFKTSVNPSMGLPDFDIRDCYLLGDSRSALAHTASALAAKKRGDFEFAKAPSRRRSGAPKDLFTYRQYAEQESLQLEDLELEKIVDSVVQPKSDTQLVLASNILVKIIMDIYQTRHVVSVAQTTHIFEEMLESPRPDVRLHAFNLLFNTAVHATMFGQQAPPAAPPLPDGAESLMTKAIIEDLFSKLKHMLQILTFSEESEDSVWAAALSTLLFFIVKDGKIVKQKLLTIEPRALPFFIRMALTSTLAVQRYVLQLLIAFLYPHQPHILDTALLPLVVDWPTLLRCYRETSSVEVKDNIFCIIFDTAVAKVGRFQSSSEQGRRLYALLRHLDSPYVFSALGFCTTPTVMPSIVDFFVQQISRDLSLRPLCTKVDLNLCGVVLHTIGSFILSFLKLEPQMEQRLNGDPSGSREEVLGLIHRLLFSSDARDRHRGVLMCAKLTLSLPASHPDYAQLATITQQTANHPQPAIRATFLHLSETLCVAYRTANDKQSVFNTINTHFGQLLSVEDKEPNIRLAVAILFRLLCFRAVASPLSDIPETDLSVSSDQDEFPHLFINGTFGVSRSLLCLVRTQVLVGLFRALPTHTRDPTRAMLLLWIHHRCVCQPNAVDSIGGPDFFKAYAADPDPLVAYYGAKCLDGLR